MCVRKQANCKSNRIMKFSAKLKHQTSLIMRIRGFKTSQWLLESHQLLYCNVTVYSDDKHLLDEVEHDIMNYQTVVCVICQSQRLRQIIQTRVLIIHYIMRKPNSIIIIVLLYILILRNRGEAFSHSVSEENTSRGLVTSGNQWLPSPLKCTNQADFELDMINTTSAADIAFIMSSSQAIINLFNAPDQSDFS